MSAKTSYLLIYNSISGVLWGLIALNNIKDIICVLNPGLEAAKTCVYLTQTYDLFPHKLLVYVQAFNASMEIMNSVVGITSSPVLMTLLQFFARLAITIGVCYLIPDSPGNFNSWAFPGVLVAWSSVEIIRYPYYAFKIAGIDPPYFLHWLRYSAFMVLYPLGLFTEPVVIYDSLGHITSSFHYYFFVFGFSLYIPGFYVLYTYMLKQRKKVLRKKKE